MTGKEQHQSESAISRRTLVQSLAVCAGTTVAAASSALAQGASQAEPPTTITSPPRDFSPRGAPTTYFWDPDIIAVDPSFNNLAQPNTSIKRLHTGLLWAEGPAWSAQGRYLVWSDIPNNRQMRWSEDDGHVSVFRSPSNYSNGNSFDFQGRQLSCEHLTRRVVRYEHDGTATVLADSYSGKRLNSPNDIVAHPDGSYWFTDPPYGGQLYEGEPDAAGGPSNSAGKLNPRIGQPAGFMPCPIPMGSRSRRTTRSFTSSRPEKGLAIPAQAAKGDMYEFDVGADNKLSNQKRFSDFMVDGVKCGPDGVQPAVKHDQEPAIIVRKPDAALEPAP